jgi:hypothetical protein
VENHHLMFADHILILALCAAAGTVGAGFRWLIDGGAIDAGPANAIFNRHIGAAKGNNLVASLCDLRKTNAETGF